MTAYEFGVQLDVKPRGDDEGLAEALEEHLDAVMEELLKLDAQDVSIGGSMTQGDVEITITVEAETYEEAVRRGLSCIRSALHAAGAHTHGWEQDVDRAITGVHADRANDDDLVTA